MTFIKGKVDIFTQNESNGFIIIHKLNNYSDQSYDSLSCRIIATKNFVKKNIIIILGEPNSISSEIFLKSINNLKKSKKSRSSGGFQWSYEKHEKISKYEPNQGEHVRKPVYMYDLFGKYLRSFESIEDTLRFFNLKLNYQNRNIFRQKLKTLKSFKKFRFSLEKVDQLDNSLNKLQKKGFIILQYDLDMNFIQIWENITEAEKALNLTSIYDNISGKTKKCNNYIFKKL